MSSVPYDVIATSKPIRFRVGPDQKEFFIHDELVARMSKPLRTLVQGEWKEKNEGLVEWSEIDEETFVRFCEFAYTGNYQPAKPQPPKVENKESAAPMEPGTQPEYLVAEDYAVQIEEPEVVVEEAPQDIWGTNPYPTKGKKKYSNRSRKDIMLSDFQNALDITSASTSSEPPMNPLADYSEVLLSHARLYALADCYDVDQLMSLCVRKLHHTLRGFDLHGGARVTDVAQLIDFSYKNTRSGSAQQDKLRNLLSMYVACYIEELWPNLYFRDVIEYGEISKDIIGKLLRRLD
ncbi:hypothetical protein ABKA04_008803 [Annulohypoxylon sp. FPYF3050]